MTLIGDLAEALGRPVDLIDLRSVGEPLLGQILAHGVRLRGSASAQAALVNRGGGKMTLGPVERF